MREGNASEGTAYRALVRNRAQLAYNGVGAWLEGKGPAPAKVAASSGAGRATQAAGQGRAGHAGKPVPAWGARSRDHRDKAGDAAQRCRGPGAHQKNRATSLIEEFMVAANGVMARTFEDAKVASIRRVVRTPKRWDRIVELADGAGNHVARGARLQGAQRISAGAEAEGPRPLSRSLAGGDQADGAGRICAGEAHRSGVRAISGWRCRTIRTPPRPTAASPTWWPSAS